jgi:broad specificity phosphatase PhoE
MNETLPSIYLVRHGETEWSITRQHTGSTDIPLTEKGEADAVQLGKSLKNHAFAKVMSSPRSRALRTCELAGFIKECEIDSDLAEWDYGQYEGITTKEIHLIQPSWDLFEDGCPGGETPDEIGERADRVLEYLKALKADVLIFSHGHFLRVLGTRWINLPANQASHFLLDTSSISILSFEHTLSRPVIKLWNSKGT